MTPKNAKELAEAIMKITDDGETYKTFVTGAEKRYRDTFTKEKMINNVLDIYNKLWMNPK